MKMRIAVFAAMLALCSSGCAVFQPIVDWLKPKPKPPVIVLPVNPATPEDIPGSKSEQWTFTTKDYDQSYRIRWPTTLSNEPYNLGAGSYVMVNGMRAEFRSYDGDGGAKRASYTMALSVVIPGRPITNIVYKADGVALAWFVTPDTLNRSGRLPTSDQVDVSSIPIDTVPDLDAEER